MADRLIATPKVLAALAAMQAADAAACVQPIAPIKQSLETVGLSKTVWPVLPVVKAASAAGLLGGIWWAALGRMTTFMLTVYFALAVGAHARVRDKVTNALPATALLGFFATLTVKGFQVRGAERVGERTGTLTN